MLANTHEANHLSSESQWIQSESIRLLMQTKPVIHILTALAMMLMAIQLYGHVNPALIFTWLAASLIVLATILNFEKLFAKQMLAEKIKYVDRFCQIWILNALIWGLSGWLFFAKLPIQNQFVSACILSTMGVISVFKLTPYRFVARRYINVLLGTQMVGIMWHIGIINEMKSPQIQYYYLYSLVILWIIFRVLGNRFYLSFHHKIVFHFRNTSLIESLKRQAKQLEHEKQLALSATETIKRFYSSAAHDIRQPVYALNVYSDLLIDNPVQMAKLIPKIKASCQAINALFHSLFDFEKIHSGQINVSLEAVDLASLFRNLETHFLPLATAKSLDFRVIATTGRLQSDPALIKVILSHLITNAIKYTHQGGLLLAARKNAESISFEVWDTGIGIDGVHLAHVFEEFYKVNEQSSADEGFGLGLSVVKRLAAFVDDSSVTLQSRVGRGSVIKFRMPLAMYSNAHESPPVPAQSLGQVSLEF